MNGIFGAHGIYNDNGKLFNVYKLHIYIKVLNKRTSPRNIYAMCTNEYFLMVQVYIVN